MKKIFVLAVCGLTILGCRKSQFEPVEHSSGEADFKHYVAVGNSLTQGFQDGGLYEEGQSMSYPAIIAQQLEMVDTDMDNFIQPMVNGNGSGYIHLEYIDNEIEVIQPGDDGGYEADPSWETWGSDFPYNNLGIAGIQLDQCVALDDNELAINQGILGGVSVTFPVEFEQPGNPYARFLDFGENPLLGGEPIQYIDHIRQSEATFFTCWLGNNDILGYATSGGVENTFDIPLVGTVSLNSLADPITFGMKYDSVLTAFNDIGAEGVCGTIPDVTVIPYFNQFTVQGLKDEYGYDNVWIEDGNGTVRIATDTDLLLLSASDAIEGGAGSSEDQYLENGFVLDAAEVSECQNATIQVNAEIRAKADKFGFAVVDMYNFLNDLKPGVTFEGIDLSPAYIEGGAFSLDGIHLNPRGYAIAANEFIKAINQYYGSGIPTVAIGNYRGVVFP